jgi:MBG domain (YGX type)
MAHPWARPSLDAASPVAGTFAYSPAAGTFLNAGQGQALSATFTSDDTADYNPVMVTAQINVTPALLTVTADDASSVAGQALPTFTAHYTGFVRGEGQGVLGGVLGLSVPPGGASQPGQYPITPGGLTSPNYAITYANGTLNVAARPVPPVPPIPPVTVQSVLWKTEALSHHKTAKVLVVTFSGGLTPNAAQNLAAYALFSAAKKKNFTRRDPLTSAVYSSSGSTSTVTLTPKGGKIPTQPLQLVLNPAMLLDTEDRPISGTVTLTLGKGGITVSSIADAHAAARLSAHAFDMLSLTDELPPARHLRRSF